MTEPLGLYIHIPFCNKKCGYCDFYSVFPIGSIVKDYTDALLKEIKKWGASVSGRPIDTVYIGGGTPSLLGEDIKSVTEAVLNSFNVTENAEITAEANPEDISFPHFAKSAGINRLSIGAQSFDDGVLSALGRRHTALDTERFYYRARECGFDNISLDLMLALPDGNPALDLERIISLSPEHISAYILKRESRTKFDKFNIPLPSDDTAADEYLLACKTLRDAGYIHYEISNFCKEGKESRHNLKYWQCGEYIGIGAAAHSFLKGKRFYYERDLKKFIAGGVTVFDSSGGEKEERLMLALRLKNGVDLSEIYEKIPDELKKKAELFSSAGYISGDFPKIRLTDRGMLVSNSIISELIL